MRIALKLIAAAAAALSAQGVAAADGDKPLATIFKNPQCTCCESYGEYLRANGYPVKMVATHDLALIKQRQGIPAGLEGCHTALVGGYFIDGHVPVQTFDRLLAERSAISGISLPGMPTGSPGMGGPKTETWTIVAVAPDGETSVYARH
jgi:hypothetical protein